MGSSPIISTVQFGHQDKYTDPSVADAQPDVVQPALVPQGDDPGVVDLVAAAKADSAWCLCLP